MAAQNAPPPAMSLRTRESSSMALKQIFDQINSSSHHLRPQPSHGSAHELLPGNGSSSNQAVEERHLFPLKRCYSDGRVNEAKTAAAPMAGQMQGASVDSRSAFRPPEQRTVRWKIGGEDDEAPHAQNADCPNNPSKLSPSWPFNRFQQGFLPQATSRPATTNPVAKQPTGQLTIFYSGTVNVYDNVPADKANAIMLLAGTDNSNSRNFTSSPILEREMIPQGTSPAGTAPTRPSSSVCGTPPAGTVPTRPSSSSIPSDTTMVPSTTRATTFTSLASFMGGTPVMRPTMAVAPSSPSTTVEAQTPTAAKRSHAGIELPHARKASLARFLEKRKDRVQVKPQGDEVQQRQEKGELNVEKPGSPNKKQCIERSSSPTPSREQ